MDWDTPFYNSLTRMGLLEDVYEPAEDTFLLMDAIQSCEAELQNCRIGLEVGPGSGVISSLVARCFPKLMMFSVDRSASAVMATALVHQENNVLLPLGL
jgi:release factor glutamine methyltransferase